MSTPSDESTTPFQAVVRPLFGEDEASAEATLPAIESDEFSQEDLESAYLRALEVAEAAEISLAEVDRDAGAVPEEEIDALPSLRETLPKVPPTAAPVATGGSVPASGPQITPKQVVEALLFVGGAPLATKRLAELLGEEFPTERVEEIISQLNSQYADENRPYEVHWGEGGYRFRLHSEYEKVRNRLYGFAPKEVKLSQDALEILAFVAYQQPVRMADLEATERKNAGAMLRQLIRRELVELKRDDKHPDEPTYRTTERFLQLFGLTTLDDLPYPADLAFK